MKNNNWSSVKSVPNPKAMLANQKPEKKPLPEGYSPILATSAFARNVASLGLRCTLYGYKQKTQFSLSLQEFYKNIRKSC